MLEGSVSIFRLRLKYLERFSRQKQCRLNATGSCGGTSRGCRLRRDRSRDPGLSGPLSKPPQAREPEKLSERKKSCTSLHPLKNGKGKKTATQAVQVSQHPTLFKP